jgi:hypothetical protein
MIVPKCITYHHIANIWAWMTAQTIKAAVGPGRARKARRSACHNPPAHAIPAQAAHASSQPSFSEHLVRSFLCACVYNVVNIHAHIHTHTHEHTRTNEHTMLHRTPCSEQIPVVVRWVHQSPAKSPLPPIKLPVPSFQLSRRPYVLLEKCISRAQREIQANPWAQHTHSKDRYAGVANYIINFC